MHVGLKGNTGRLETVRQASLALEEIYLLLLFSPVHVLSFPNGTGNAKLGPEGRAYYTAMVIPIVLFCSSSASNKNLHTTKSSLSVEHPPISEPLASMAGCMHLHFWMLKNTRSDLDGIPYFPASVVVCGMLEAQELLSSLNAVYLTRRTSRRPCTFSSRGSSPWVCPSTAATTRARPRYFIYVVGQGTGRHWGFRGAGKRRRAALLLLLEAGADVHATNDEGDTLLHVVAGTDGELLQATR